MGTQAAVQNRDSHRLIVKHRGQGLRNHQSCDATVLTLTPGAASMTASGKRKEKKKHGSPSGDPSEGSFSSMSGLQRPNAVGNA